MANFQTRKITITVKIKKKKTNIRAKEECKKVNFYF